MSPKHVRKKKQNKQQERPIFAGIRKPVAPPGHPMSHAKPEEKASPAGRKAKHKGKLEKTILEDPE